MLQTTHGLISYDRNAFVDLWDWCPLFAAFDSDDVDTRWYTVECISAILGMSDQRTQELHSRFVHFGEDCLFEH